MRILVLMTAFLGVLLVSSLALLLVRSNSELDATLDNLEASRSNSEKFEADLGAARDDLASKTAKNEALTTNLDTTRERLNDEIAENEALTADLNSTSERLTSKAAENETLTADLNSTSERLTSKAAENETLTADLNTTNKRLTSKTAENETLTADLNTTSERLTNKTAENQTLTYNLNTTREQLVRRTAESETLATEFRKANEQLSSETVRANGLAADLESAKSLLAEKTSEHQALTNKHETLVKEVGTLQEVRGEVVSLNSRAKSLVTQVTGLEEDIVLLERRRRPLIVDSYQAGFKCTGSMEPRITCLDSATWLDNFYPEDIVVGTVISFTPTPGCELGSGSVAHRVVSIRRDSSGVYYYWPKGDASAEDDGCWIPHANVDGYIIDLHKNVHPENSALRNRVTTAKANFEVAERNYAYALAVHDAKQAHYDSLRLRYCGTLTGECSLPTDQFNELTALRKDLLSGIEELLHLLEVWTTAAVVWEVAYYEALIS